MRPQPAPEQVTDRVRELFTDPARARYGPFTLLRDGAGETVVADTLYRYIVQTDDGGAPTALSLLVFTNVGSALAGPLWEQEIRVLTRISGIGHEALPSVHSGGFDAEHHLAWVAVQKVDETLAGGGAAFYRSNQPEALRKLMVLADALAVLHGHGIVHRSLWPGAIDAILSEDAPPRLLLGRFEMSSMLTNLLRGSVGAADARTAQLKDQLRGGASALAVGDLGGLAYCPPERLDFLLGSGGAELTETERGDVFSLGVIAWEWFVGDMPIDDCVVDRRTDGALRDGLVRLHDQLRKGLRESDLPKNLKRVLSEMLTASPGSRATSANVVDQLSRGFEGMLGALDDDMPSDDLVIGFMPDRVDRTLVPWGLASLDPVSDAGKSEIKEVIEQDLRGATLVYSPQGAVDHVPGSTDEKKRRAKAVLLGKQVAWFCWYYEATGWDGKKVEDEDVLAILYPLELHRNNVRDLGQTPFRRTISSVKALPMPLQKDVLDHVRTGASWKPLVESTRQADESSEQSTFLSALGWFVDHQAAELSLHEYPYIRRGSAHAEWVELELDHERAQLRNRGDDLLTVLQDTVPTFGDFAVSDEAFGARGVLEYVDDDNGRPGRDGGDILATDRQSDDHIRVRVAQGRRTIPERGWLRGGDARAASIVLQRQRAAVRELRGMKGLQGQLVNPHSVSGAVDRWRDAGSDLRGGADAIVRKMLTSEPFFALHGPPGTGKTTVVARAIDAFLAEEPGARVLVSAQANDSLDNLALRILKRVEGRLPEVLPLRIGRDESRMDPAMRRWQLDSLVVSVIGRIRGTAKARIDERIDPEPVREVLGRWVAALDESGLELRDRLRRGANLVFATTSGANPQDLDVTGAYATYDWVLVEEAAKAWPSELAIPLVRGVRWTLIGDHRQLPAFRRREISDVLALCARQDHLPKLKAHGDRKADYEAVFDFFAGLFEPGPRKRPVDRLVRQFRMRAPIATVVSKSFYELRGDPPLQTDSATEVDSGVTRPAALRGQALVWLDTVGAGCAQQPQWSNPGEADIIGRLVAQLDPLADIGRDSPHASERLAILTPWHAQREKIENRLSSYRRFVHTVDAFQGREADIVIVSLVRDHGWGDSPPALLGHLADEHRVNVMLSRARRLCVIVGAHSHFAGCGVDFWQSVCRETGEHGRVLLATEVLG